MIIIIGKIRITIVHMHDCNHGISRKRKRKKRY
jgi:hypothetical protein